MKNKLATLVGALALSAAASAQTWIWYPGDYEIWLGNRMNNRRTERGAFFPPFWKTDSHYVVVEFSKKLDLAEPEEIFIAAEGKYNVKLDGKLQFGMRSFFTCKFGIILFDYIIFSSRLQPRRHIGCALQVKDRLRKPTSKN